MGDDYAGDVLVNLFDEFGYIIAEKLTNLTYEEVKKIISDEIGRAELVIKKKDDELRRQKAYLSALEYNLRTVWLLFQDDRPPERKVLG